MVEIQQSYGKRSKYEIRLYHTEVHSTDSRDLPIHHLQQYSSSKTMAFIYNLLLTKSVPAHATVLNLALTWEDTEAFYWKYNPTQGCFLRGQLIRLNPI